MKLLSLITITITILSYHTITIIYPPHYLHPLHHPQHHQYPTSIAIAINSLTASAIALPDHFLTPIGLSNTSSDLLSLLSSDTDSFLTSLLSFPLPLFKFSIPNPAASFDPNPPSLHTHLSLSPTRIHITHPSSCAIGFLGAGCDMRRRLSISHSMYGACCGRLFN